MVIGYASGNLDDTGATASDFAFVLLAPLGQGQSISATDDGWDPADKGGAFFGNQHHSEYHLTHTAAVEEPAGTVLTLSNFSSR